MQEVVDTQTNLSKLIDNQELSSWTFEDMMSFIGADEATFAQSPGATMLCNRKQYCKDVGFSYNTDHPRLYDVKRKLVSWCHKPSGGAGGF